MEVLKDLKCLDGLEVRPCWTAKDPRMPQAGRVAALYLIMPGKPEAHIHPITGKLFYEVVSFPAYMVTITNFADKEGGVHGDDRIKTLVREKVEEYLAQFTVRPGCNGPKDFRLGEWDYD